MTVKIRLARGGAKKRPYYYVVAANSTAPRDGRYIERVGSYNPMLKRDDPNRVKLDVERCKRESPFKTPIAHGNLTLCILSSIARNADVELPPSKMGINYGSNKVRFTGVVPVGSRIRGRYKLLDVKDVDARTILVNWGVTGEIEGGTKPILIAETLSRRSA